MVALVKAAMAASDCAGSSIKRRPSSKCRRASGLVAGSTTGVAPPTLLAPLVPQALASRSKTQRRNRLID